MSNYREGRNDALATMGLRQQTRDNPLVNDFVASLGESEVPTSRANAGSNRPLNRQSWGKTFNYTTSDQIVNGGGTRL